METEYIIPMIEAQQAQIDAITATQAEFLHIAETQAAYQADLVMLLTAAVIGIGFLLGSVLYRIVRGAWEVS